MYDGIGGEEDEGEAETGKKKREKRPRRNEWEGEGIQGREGRATDEKARAEEKEGDGGREKRIKWEMEGGKIVALEFVGIVQLVKLLWLNV